MADEAAVPPGLRDTIRALVNDEIARYASSGPLRNASISGLPGLTVKAGSKITIEHPDGSPMVLAGAYDINDTFDMPDGSDQPMFLLRRADGTLALAMYDPDPVTGGFQQFLALLDRSGNIIVSDDTASGQGLARPYVGATFYKARYADWVTTTSSTFETMWTSVFSKQHPTLYVQALASNDTSGATGEVRVLVNGVQWGTTASTAFSISAKTFGPLPIDGAHMASTKVDIQARLATGTGGVRLEPTCIFGRQT